MWTECGEEGIQAIWHQDVQLGLQSAVVTVMEFRVQHKERKLSYRQRMKASDNTEFRNRWLKGNEEAKRRM